MKINIQMKTVTYLLATVLVLVGFSSSRCFADLWDGTLGWSLSGTLSTEEIPPDLLGFGDWTSGTSVEWSVQAIDDGFQVIAFEYIYTFPELNPSPDWSHIILALSAGVTEDEIWGYDPLIIESIGELYEDDMPGDGIYGMKFEMPIAGVDMPLTVSFYSQRVPVWGDIWLKGGHDSYAYNPYFDDPWNPEANPDGWGYLATPDTYSVPLPGALILGMLGLGAVGIKLRKYA